MKTVEQIKLEIYQLRSSPKISNEHIDAFNEASSRLIHADAVAAAEISSQILTLTAHNNYVRGRAYALRNIGWSYLVRDHCQEAETNFNESQKLFRAIKDSNGQATVKNGLAAVQKKLGNYQAALNEYSAALELYQNNYNQDGIALILKNFGCVHVRFGNYIQALDYYYRALSAAAASNSVIVQAYAQNDLADILWRLNEHSSAIEFLQNSLDFYQVNSDFVNKSVALVNLGAVHLSLKQFDRAADYFWQSLQFARNFDNSETEIESLIGLGNILSQQGDACAALAHFQEALQVAQNMKSRFYTSDILLSLGIIYRQLNQGARSIEALHEALNVSQEIEADAITYKIHFALFEEFQKQENFSAALSHHQAFHQIWRNVYGTATPATKRLIEQGHAGTTLQSINSNAFEIVLNEGDAGAGDDKNFGLTPRKLQAVINHIHQHLDENISSKELSEVIGTSESHFRRSFKLSTGQTPHQYVLEKRIAHSKLLLQNTNLPITEIAHQCGFSSHSHFATHFRLLTGATPHHFRQNS